MDRRIAGTAGLVIALFTAASALRSPALAAPFGAATPQPGIASVPQGTPPSGFSARVLLAPLGWVLGTVGLAPGATPFLPNSARLRREDGWIDLTFPLDDDAVGVYFEVVGRVEFATAIVDLADGGTHNIDLHHATRGRGLYELRDLGQARHVAGVRLRALARSTTAAVGVRLGR